MEKNKANKFTSPKELADIQNEKAEIDVMAGISNFNIIFTGYKFAIILTLAIFVSTQKTRGVHMSRLVKAAQNNMKINNIEEVLINIQKEVSMTQSNCKIIANFKYPYNDQFLDVEVILDNRGQFYYKFGIIGITSCPCSKAITGIGHMQRTKLKMEICRKEYVDFNNISENMITSFSAKLEEFMNRADEANKIIEAQNNSKFVEDVIRDCLKKFPDAEFIEAKSYESIHSHEAIAYWKK